MDRADGRPCTGSFRACLKEEMGAFFPGRLEDHAFTINGIDASVFPNAVGIDHVDIQMQAAPSAAETDHAGCTILLVILYCDRRWRDYKTNHKVIHKEIYTVE